MPPEGKLDASGSPWISCLPVNSAIAPPLPSGLEEAVVLLGGEAGEGIEHVRVVRGAFLDRPVLHGCATTSATLASSFAPCLMVLESAL
jgi:hypothetical protein